jgi:hypothetical protein
MINGKCDDHTERRFLKVGVQKKEQLLHPRSKPFLQWGRVSIEEAVQQAFENFACNISLKKSLL